MKSSKITFEDLKNIHERDEDFFIDYINKFSGNNIYEKFKNILISWERDVSYDIEFLIGGKNIRIALYYLLEELENFNKEPFIIENDIVKVLVDIPENFKKEHDIFSIFDFIKKMTYLNFDVDFTTLSESEKNIIMENLPASIYNFLINNIYNNDRKSVFIQNLALNNMIINFMSNSPYLILRGLFKNYNSDYFREIIYLLSRKIDGGILMNSTMKDIEFYIEKISQEGADHSQNQDLY